jgi:uncharacterized protein (TIGR02145 family)
MKRSCFYYVTLPLIVCNAFGQQPYLEMTFTAGNNGQHLILDSIYVRNLSTDADTILFAPDTLLLLNNYTGISENRPEKNNIVDIRQNYPNPGSYKTSISIQLFERLDLIISVTDISGREVAGYHNVLEAGNHSFTFRFGHEHIYLCTVKAGPVNRTIKMIGTNNGESRSCLLTYEGMAKLNLSQKSQQAIELFEYNLGDTLLIVGYVGGLESGKLSMPVISGTFHFEFATNIQCINMQDGNYHGQKLKTIQIFSQCWLKENMNVGTMVMGNVDQTNNDILEKYCYNNNPVMCETYGGLYQWDEMMQYSTVPGTQGICPAGWHIPCDEDWKILKGATDSQYPIGSPVWDSLSWWGFDNGLNLKSPNYWQSGGVGIDLYGFTGLPAGQRINATLFVNLNAYGQFWSTTTAGADVVIHNLGYDSDASDRNIVPKSRGRSVRCIRND